MSVRNEFPVHLDGTRVSTGFRFGCPCGWFVTWGEQAVHGDEARVLISEHRARHREEIAGFMTVKRLGLRDESHTID